MHKIFNTDSRYSNAYFTLEFDGATSFTEDIRPLAWQLISIQLA